ncbi:MAG: type II secretion system F family protein [bacterium]|nr:type II secretion system F family protein [bacterium]
MAKKKELTRKIYNKKTVDKVDNRIKLLGVYNKMNAITFLNIRLFTSIIVFVISVYIFDFGYVIAPLLTISYYYFIYYIMIENKIKKRSSKLEAEAMYFFEVLTLSLETGRNLSEALQITIKSVNSEISDEFKEALREVKFGKSLSEALIDINDKMPSVPINNIILTLTQTDLFGNSIIDNMYNQIEYLREKKKMEVKAAISKVPIKVSIISVLFFVPLILLIILAPVLLTYIT